jgi:enoyl-CoA hydratase/carnithine racemase
MANEIEVERPGAGVAVLTLNGPERRNALTVVMAEELVAAQMWSMRRKALGERA